MYRTIELVDGLEGRIIKNGLHSNVMDEAMIVASMYCLNIFHPGQLLGTASLDSRTNSPEKAKETGELRSCGYVPNHIIDKRSKV